MNRDLQPSIEQELALKALLLVSRNVNESLLPFCNWLTLGSGASFSLVVANIQTVSNFLNVVFIRWGIIVFLISLILSIFANYLAAILKASLSAQAEADVLGSETAKSSDDLIDVNKFMNEYGRGLFPPFRYFAESAMKKTIAGDIVAAARMVAKLSQTQSVLVLIQCLFSVIALMILALGIKI